MVASLSKYLALGSLPAGLLADITTALPAGIGSLTNDVGEQASVMLGATLQHGHLDAGTASATSGGTHHATPGSEPAPSTSQQQQMTEAEALQIMRKHQKTLDQSRARQQRERLGEKLKYVGYEGKIVAGTSTRKRKARATPSTTPSTEKAMTSKAVKQERENKRRREDLRQARAVLSPEVMATFQREGRSKLRELGEDFRAHEALKDVPKDLIEKAIHPKKAGRRPRDEAAGEQQASPSLHASNSRGPLGAKDVESASTSGVEPIHATSPSAPLHPQASRHLTPVLLHDPTSGLMWSLPPGHHPFALWPEVAAQSSHPQMPSQTSAATLIRPTAKRAQGPLRLPVESPTVHMGSTAPAPHPSKEPLPFDLNEPPSAPTHSG